MAYTDDDNESENSEHPITLEFQDNFESLQTDITHIVLRQQAIQLHLTSLDSTVARIETFLQQTSPSNVKAVASGQTTSPTAKTHLYNALNRSLELIAKFNDSYNKLLELKLRYRQEQDNLQYKIVRMINLELKKTDELGEVTQDHIMKVLSVLAGNLSKVNSNVAPALDNKEQNKLSEFNSKVADIKNIDDYEM